MKIGMPLVATSALPWCREPVSQFDAEVGLLGNKSVREATMEFNAMCEGLANAELRETILSILPTGQEERAWRHALVTVVRGWTAAPQRRRSERRDSH